MSELIKIGLGGGCHWCTEAIFQSLTGVEHVEQGWISSDAPNDSWSEAVIVHFRPELIDLATLVEVHLYTHSCTEVHSMRHKYRSAVYIFSMEQMKESREVLANLQHDFEKKLITKVLPFRKFKLNQESYLNYYYSDPEKPFCRTYIHPKLQILLNQFSTLFNYNKMR